MKLVIQRRNSGRPLPTPTTFSTNGDCHPGFGMEGWNALHSGTGSKRCELVSTVNNRLKSRKPLWANR